MTAADARRVAWEQRTGPALAVLGLLFLAAYTTLVLVPDAPDALLAVLALIGVVTWTAFAFDMIVRIAGTDRGRRWRFVLTHPVDVLALFVPLFRALRVVGLLRHIAFFRGRSGSAVRGTVIVHALVYAALFVFVIALATLQVERSAPDATITSFGNAIWWAIVTLATVGYGDTYPVTVTGRFLAVILMTGGIVIVGTTSAIVVSYITERVASARDAQRTVEAQPPSSASSAS